MAKLFGDRWEVTGEFTGEGGQGWVYEVRDKTQQLPGTFVLKRLKRPDHPARLERFRREVEVLTKLSSPHIVRLIDANLEVEPPYFVTEHCEGGDLTSLSVPLEPLDALRILIEACDGLAAAHGSGITHRDIKPQNVLLRTPSGPAVVADFGLSYVEEGRRLTLTDERVGGSGFLAPEVEHGRADVVSPRSDVYSLGKLLYWLLTDRVFPRESFREADWNLVNVLQDNRMEHLNRLLDYLAAFPPEARKANASEVAEIARLTADLLDGHFNVITSTLPQPCKYCGIGKYQLAARNAAEMGDFAFRPQGRADWLILVCDACGHVQWFRLDKAQLSRFWREP